jgi:hypothetical protein
MPVGQFRFLFGNQYRSRLGSRRNQRQPEQKPKDLSVTHRFFLLTNTDCRFYPKRAVLSQASRGAGFRR